MMPRETSCWPLCRMMNARRSGLPSRRSYDLTVEKANALKVQSTEALQAVKEKAEAAYEFASTKLSASGDTIADAVSTTAKAVSDRLDEINGDTSVHAKYASISRKAARIF